MYTTVLGASTVTAVAGATLLPNTGNTRVLFIVAATLLAAGVVTLVLSSLSARKHNKTQA